MGLPRTMKSLLSRMLQKRRPESVRECETKLSRTLTLLDITLQGVAHMVGAGIIMLVPILIATRGGPGFFVSMALGGLAMGLTALSYTDLSSRYSCIGNAYVYVYTGIGEFPALIVASITVGEFLLHVPLMAKLCARHLDTMFFGGGFMGSEQRFYKDVMGVPEWFLGHTDGDILTMMILALAVLIALLPIKSAAVLSSVTCSISMTLMLVYSGVGLWHGDIDNLTVSDPTEEGSNEGQQGGFLPFGWEGLLRCTGISAIFYSGFETTSSLAEEAIHPQRDIPRATFLSYVVVIVFNVVVTFCMVYFRPWYEFGEGIFPTLVDFPVLQYVIGVAIVAISFSVLIAMTVADVRILFALAEDGLIPAGVFGVVTRGSRIPWVTTLLVGGVFEVVAICFTDTFISDVISGGILSVFICVNISLVCISFTGARNDDKQDKRGAKEGGSGGTSSCEITPLVGSTTSGSGGGSTLSRHLLRLKERARTLVEVYPPERILLFIMTLYLFTGALPIILIQNTGFTPASGVVSGVSGLVALALLCFIPLAFTPAPPGTVPTPGKPFLQGLAIILNMILMESLRRTAVIATTIYIAVGCLTYFSYGIRNSRLTREKEQSEDRNESSM